jgi:membrane protein
MAGIKERFAAERARRAWLDHLLSAGSAYKDRRGDYFAAAITYFSILALFPLILLGVSVLGFVLAGQQHLFNELIDKVNKSVPSGMTDTVGDAITFAVQHRGSVGAIGVLGFLYAGLGWIGNLRTSVQSMWGYEPDKASFVGTKLRDLLALVGLGLAIIVSLGLTAAGTAATNELVSLTHADDIPGISVFTRIVGIVIAIAADMLIFGWMLTRLPRSPLTFRAVAKGALFASIGFEILKVGGTYYIARVAKSPSAAALGSILGLLVWVNLVSRFLLFATAWTATSPSVVALHEPAPAPEPVEEPIAMPSGGKVAAGLLGVGFAVGMWLSRGARRRSERTAARRRAERAAA